MNRHLDLRAADLWYTVRRWHVDAFFARRAAALPEGARVVDLGGKRLRKRGQFDIGRFAKDVVYVNSDPATGPDLLCDAARVPLPDASCDAVLCGELLEHVAHPEEVLREAWRLLRPGGVLLLTTPFHCEIHPDPQDYARYTDTWLRAALARAGFVAIEVERQGRFLSVAADMLKKFAAENVWPRRRLTRRLFLSGVACAVRRAVRLERAGWGASSRLLAGYTTGFGVSARRPHGGSS